MTNSVVYVNMNKSSARKAKETPMDSCVRSLNHEVPIALNFVHSF